MRHKGRSLLLRHIMPCRNQYRLIFKLHWKWKYKNLHARRWKKEKNGKRIQCKKVQIASVKWRAILFRHHCVDWLLGLMNQNPQRHWGQPREATVVKMAPTRPLVSRSFCLLAPLWDHRSLSNLQQSNTRVWYTMQQNDRLVPFLVFVQ